MRSMPTLQIQPQTYLGNAVDIGELSACGEFIRYLNLPGGHVPERWQCVKEGCTAIFEANPQTSTPTYVEILLGRGIRRCESPPPLSCRFVRLEAGSRRISGKKAEVFLRGLFDMAGGNDPCWGIDARVCRLCGVVCSQGFEPRVKNSLGPKTGFRTGELVRKVAGVRTYVSQTGDRCECGATHSGAVQEGIRDELYCDDKLTQFLSVSVPWLFEGGTEMEPTRPFFNKKDQDYFRDHPGTSGNFVAGSESKYRLDKAIERYRAWGKRVAAVGRLAARCQREVSVGQTSYKFIEKEKS